MTVTLLDPTKTHVFVWVPGTGGHEVHPAFYEAAMKATSGDCAFVCLEYPASVNFVESSTRGVRELKAALERIAEVRAPHQVVYLAGSSQGAWVVGDCLYNNQQFLDGLLRKAVLFGGPGIRESNDFNFFYEERVWEIDNKNDAVTFGWDSKKREEIVSAFSGLTNGNYKGLLTLLKYVVKDPRLLWRFTILTYLHLRPSKYVDSPHDYSNQMPLAIYWLMH